MKLLRLALENWRGVPSREVAFAENVTLIEGPNEIGKSTFIEALLTLFNELDSSNKKNVKAIQPVGQDVGSQVEAELITGDFHIVYSKTYNKNKQTVLRILAPKAEQLTGREAHERVEQILDATIDMGLWNALLVEQGKEILGVHLADSDGLARALDGAAGSSSAEQDDSDLFRSVQAEYEQYFTLKSGKPKFAGLENELAEARVAVDVARAALSAIDVDSTAYERSITEVHRLEGALPELQNNVAKYQTDWQGISSLQQQVATKQSELDSAQQLQQAAVDEQNRRTELIDDLTSSSQTLEEKSEQLTPLDERTKALKTASDEADSALKTLKTEIKQAHATLDLARADEEHLQALARLDKENLRLTRLREFMEKAEAERTRIAGIKINTAGLETLRQAESELQVAIGKRDTATSTIEIAAEQDLEITFNDEQLELAAGAAEKRSVAAELRVGIPGVANILVTPSQSAADLEANVLEHEEALSALLDKYAIKNLADAIATEAMRNDAVRDLESWNDKIIELLGDDSEADIKAAVTQLQLNCNSYASERVDETPIPESIEQATVQTQSANRTLNDCIAVVESQQEECDLLHGDYRDADASHLVAIQEVDGLKQDSQRRQKKLDEARTAEPDNAVQNRTIENTTAVENLQGELTDLNKQLESASPETTEALLTNAREAYQRAGTDLQDLKRDCAVLEDRLTQAQANGRFETLEAAERELEELEVLYEGTTKRAAAAERLWQTLNKHRDATRKAYIRPLKDGIEQLGKIMFGSDFSIDLGDDWAILSCTRDAKTMPFEFLSVGMKEQLGILTRLAAARIVSNLGGVPLIIDDALGFSDPGRLETMGAAITATGKDSQIILLTCTPGRFTHVGSAEVVRL